MTTALCTASQSWAAGRGISVSVGHVGGAVGGAIGGVGGSVGGIGGSVGGISSGISSGSGINIGGVSVGNTSGGHFTGSNFFSGGADFGNSAAGFTTRRVGAEGQRINTGVNKGSAAAARGLKSRAARPSPGSAGTA